MLPASCTSLRPAPFFYVLFLLGRSWLHNPAGNGLLAAPAVFSAHYSVLRPGTNSDSAAAAKGGEGEA
ncbi:hypothetical protein Y1Q_0010430 [Alligator mississippiensis]|uniref:Uncharacterized protein n=1 Tax=Alligator mississippiensis TaxID=8496 RepID=A0A151NJY3_ALLMI|nr:hypothetical protein Y1Q_0010430 [Alligator mississippiensis]